MHRQLVLTKPLRVDIALLDGPLQAGLDKRSTHEQRLALGVFWIGAPGRS